MYVVSKEVSKDGRKEGRKEGRKGGREEGRRKKAWICMSRVMYVKGVQYLEMEERGLPFQRKTDKG